MSPRLARAARLLWRLTLLGLGLSLILGAALWYKTSARVRLEAPAATLRFVDHHGAFLGERADGDDPRLGYWPIDPSALPSRVVAATLAIEDKRFFEHPGVDLKAVARAAMQNLRSGRRVSGASTLAMQLARLQDPAARGWRSKLLEAVTALRLVHRDGHASVLAHYLRIAPYGNNVHGIAYAARRYFDKPLADLSWAQIAFLAGLPQAPGRMNPYTASGKRAAVARGQRILDILRADQVIEAVDWRRARLEIADLRIPPRPTRPPEAIHALLSFDPPASLGPQISTHLDLALQRDLQASLQAQLEGWRADGAGNGALIVVERPSSLDPEAPDGAGRWRLRALIGSADYHAARDHGAIDFTRALRLPGSTLKPFLYAHALEQGALRPTQVMDDLQRARGGVTNADRRFLGPLLPRVALANSRNVPAVELMMRVGLPGFFRLLGELGLHDGEADPRRYGEGLAIGGMPTRLIDLARAYTALAGDGRLASLSRFLGEPLPPARRIFSEGVARRVTLMLSDPMARLPTFPRMGHGELPFAAAIKTGTSSSYRDALAVGWSERYLVLAWVGRPDGQPTRGLSGYRAGAALVGATLRRLHPQARDGVSEGGFPAPEGSQPVSLCALSGQRATSACPSRIIEPLLPQEVPHADCAWHTRDDARGGVSLHLPPRYMAWANERGLPAHAREAPWGPQDEIKVELLTPRPNLRLRLDPDAPAALSTLKLQATVEPPVEQVVFYVDGRPFAVVDPPYTARWPLRPGAHVIEARLPFSDLRSTPVQLIVH